MEPNIWDPLIDSLSYYQKGNFTRFNNCFSRVLESLNLDLEKELYFKLRKRYFHMARVLGFLEINPSSLASDWSLNPPSLIKTSNGYILISAPHIATDYPELLESFKDHSFDIYCEQENAKSFCRVALKRSRILPESLKRKFRGNNFHIIESVEEEILTKLPPIDIVNKSCLKPSSIMLPEFYSEAERFIFDKSKWVSAKSFDLYSSALFRKKNSFGKYVYQIRINKNNNLEFYTVAGDEWAYLLGASLYGESLGLRYDKKKLKLFRPFGSGLPTLIERLLISNSMTPPQLNKAKVWTYENVPASIVRKVFTLYPSLV